MELFCIVHAHAILRHSHTDVLFEASGRKSKYFPPPMFTRRRDRNEIYMAVVISNVFVHTGTCTQTKPITVTFERAGQSRASLPCRSLRVSTETDVSRGSGLSGLRRGVQHASSASHSQTTRGAASSQEPRLHNLGQCRWSHPDGEEGRHHRPTWIPASSRARILPFRIRM